MDTSRLLTFLWKRENLASTLTVLLCGAVSGVFVQMVLSAKGIDHFLSLRLSGSVMLFSALYCLVWFAWSRILSRCLNLELSKALAVDSVTYLPSLFLLLYPITRGRLVLSATVLSMAIMKLVLFGNRTLRSAESRKPLLSGGGALACLSGLISAIAFNLTYSLPLLIDDLTFVARNPSFSYDEKMRAQWGDFYDFMCFTRNNTPPEATIVLPTQNSVWPSLSNRALVNYFLYPRKLSLGLEMVAHRSTGPTFRLVAPGEGRVDSSNEPLPRGRTVLMKAGWGLVELAEDSL